MALPTFTFNTSTGSDTQASGSGTPSTAVFGTNASFSGSVFTLDGSPDLSTVPTDGTGVLWCQTSSGRQFFTINAKDNGAKTVTTDDAPAGTSTGRTWAIGGKRNTWDATTSRNLFATSLKAGWSIVTEANQAMTANLTLANVGDVATGPVRISGSGGVRTITHSANASTFTGSGIYYYSSLKFANSNGTKTAAIAATISAGQQTFYQCTFGDATNTLLNGASVTGVGRFYDCEFTATTSHAIVTSGAAAAVRVEGCWIHGATGSGCGINHTSASASANIERLTVRETIIAGNAGDGIFSSSGTIANAMNISDNVIHGNSGDGIDVSTTAADSAGIIITGNNITANSGYGINGNASTDAFKLLIDYNNYGTGVGIANSLGATNNVTQGTHDITVDPGYVATGSNNWATTKGVVSKGWPDATRTVGNNNSGTPCYVDIGMQIRPLPMLHPGMTGGGRG